LRKILQGGNTVPGWGKTRNGGAVKLPRRPGRGIFLLSLLLLLAFLASPTLAAPVGNFIQVEGKVEVLRQGKPPAVPAKIRDGVDKGDQVRTKSQSRAQLRFVDDTVLTLSPGSSVLIEEYLYDGSRGYRQAALNLFRGLTYTVVNRILQTEKPDFVVKTHTAVLGVRGTRFFTLVGARFTGGYNEQGEVEMAARALPTSTVLLRRMEFAVAPVGRALTRGRLSMADLNLLRQWLVTGVPQRVLTGDAPFLSHLGPPDRQLPSLDALEIPREREGGMFVPPTVVPQVPTTPAPTPTPTPHHHY
jgi:hypothetical protein